MTTKTAAAWVARTLDYEFRDEGLLARALTHRSASGTNNERLEFLGDAVLQLVISEVVFFQGANASEGRLSRLRSLLVKDTTLSEIAVKLGIGEYLTLGPGERKTGGHRRSSILADALEAVFGAVSLDSGFDAAKHTIHTVYADRLANLGEEGELRDPKSRLQEFLQGRGLALPAYAVEKVIGKAHKQRFKVSCTIDDPVLRTDGSGTTRQDAEQEAAAAMLDVIDQTID